MMEKFESYPIINGVRRLNGSAHPFEAKYLFVREKENRILTDQQVAKLPQISNEHPHHKEWMKRAQSSERFLDYLKTKPAGLQILEIGCGNGWFSNQMASLDHTVVAQDLNLYELEQGRRVFLNEKLHFIYAHDVTQVLENYKFDLIVFNASFQYFLKANEWLNELKKHLNPNGEIHIIDTPFYQNDKEKNNAKLRTKAYYDKMNCPELAEFYHHYSFDELGEYELLYKPKFSRLSKLFGKTVSPFCWVKLT